MRINSKIMHKKKCIHSIDVGLKWLSQSLSSELFGIWPNKSVSQYCTLETKVIYDCSNLLSFFNHRHFAPISQ